ncbi:MAG: CDP-alcohol phosphatidyltransferase family protein [Gammaproteobacteria bacterium]|nr:MAG: CDP-alcohol phosphatidyltransferase family protein [Gammaproteobacteria bacterium]
MRHLPNVLTLLRLALVYPVVMALLHEHYSLALGLFVIAGITDALDGYLAKHRGWKSRLGAILDPLADKALLTVSYLTLTWLGLIPWWLTAIVIGRDVLIVLGALAYHFFIAPLSPSPTYLSKLNTFAQILLVIAVILQQSLHLFPPVFIQGLFYGVLLTTLLSGADYVWTWGRKAWSIRHERSAAP